MNKRVIKSENSSPNPSHLLRPTDFSLDSCGEHESTDASSLPESTQSERLVAENHIPCNKNLLSDLTLLVKNCGISLSVKDERSDKFYQKMEVMDGKEVVTLSQSSLSSSSTTVSESVQMQRGLHKPRKETKSRESLKQDSSLYSIGIGRGCLDTNMDSGPVQNAPSAFRDKIGDEKGFESVTNRCQLLVGKNGAMAHGDFLPSNSYLFKPGDFLTNSTDVFVKSEWDHDVHDNDRFRSAGQSFLSGEYPSQHCTSSEKCVEGYKSLNHVPPQTKYSDAYTWETCDSDDKKSQQYNQDFNRLDAHMNSDFDDDFEKELLDLLDEDDFEDKDSKDSKDSQPKSSGFDSSKLPPIGVFWDIENCRVPRGLSATHVVQAVRSRFFNGHREAEFMCVCDTLKELHNILEELNDAQVNIVHVGSTVKNAADDKLLQSMRRFADIHGTGATIVLISGDSNFATELYDLRYRYLHDLFVFGHSNR
ncbi:hypothetical protein SK128_020987 [Halocaridina rubra]|uniref:NYN domain-containing protein n=1 Tax=Halocaridina rubra TaxID=373956 RepID=A0AAN9AF31_HALRR